MDKANGFTDGYEDGYCEGQLAAAQEIMYLTISNYMALKKGIEFVLMSHSLHNDNAQTIKGIQVVLERAPDMTDIIEEIKKRDIE